MVAGVSLGRKQHKTPIRDTASVGTNAQPFLALYCCAMPCLAVTRVIFFAGSGIGGMRQQMSKAFLLAIAVAATVIYWS